MFRTTSLRTHVVALGLIGVTVSGCGGTSLAADDEPAITPVHVSSSSQIELPVARYASSAADDKAIFAAVNLAQKACATKFGVDASVPVTTQPTQMDLDTARRYGVVNPAEVARYGYLTPPSAQDADDSKATGWNPSPLEAEVISGHSADGHSSALKARDGSRLPQGGCGGYGFQQVWGGKVPPAGNDLVEQILADAWSKTLTDSRALSAAASWSSCMGKHGYHFQHRWDAGNSVQGKSQDVQTSMAKLDLSCARKTGYIDTWYAVDTAYQLRLIDEHKGELEAAVKQHDDETRRARAILQAGM